VTDLQGGPGVVRDYLSREICVGDEVVYAVSSPQLSFQRGVVKDIVWKGTSFHPNWPHGRIPCVRGAPFRPGGVPGYQGGLTWPSIRRNRGRSATK